jgi:hypothetical protein
VLALLPFVGIQKLLLLSDQSLNLLLQQQQ